ncbi:isocitrate dehydrogenase [Staphylococcus gallinarum]|uniref:Isocitrate dehydrogenase n=1 Tax=Staphylococcus gallinarum TaxID=1293 RepID=A0A380FJK1_STAGA|nr:isocitrate dehydrogenase [Staphylococcus gallinarum]
MAGEKVIKTNEGLTVPNNPIIPFIIGDGIGTRYLESCKSCYRRCC